MKLIFYGSSGSMEPVGLVKIFKCSLDYKLRYKHFVSDGDNSTLVSLMKENPYGEDCERAYTEMNGFCTS